MTVEAKGFLMSKTFYGCVLTAISVFAPHIFVSVFGQNADIAKVTEEIGTAVGMVLAMYGRWTAYQPLAMTNRALKEVPEEHVVALTQPTAAPVAPVAPVVPPPVVPTSPNKPKQGW